VKTLCVRAGVGFLVAPAVIPIFAAALASADGESFILWLGFAAGYGFAFIFGIPAFFILFFQPNLVRIRFFLLFCAFCTSVMWILFSTLLIYQDGRESLFSATLWGYTFLFAVSCGLTVSIFYFIVFHQKGKTRW
jgi:hypothetical protein